METSTETSNVWCELWVQNMQWKIRTRVFSFQTFVKTWWVVEIVSKNQETELIDILFRMIGPNGELIHKCKCCAKLFRSKAETSKHMTEMHGHKLNCSFCERTFNTPESRRYHMQAHHGYAGPVHICSKCGKFKWCSSRKFRWCSFIIFYRIIVRQLLCRCRIFA